ncbi:hypothetical protein [Prevotella melaninogenica]|jgi:hypothetical protein|uniref:hypothetical protein n=1 Tax=Prevotella melaninogenica TaxID=28132 RepID=UPI003C784DEF
MLFKNKHEQISQLLASHGKKYIAPCTSIISVEVTPLLAASGPEASVEDINYGGDLTGDVDDQ